MLPAEHEPPPPYYEAVAAAEGPYQVRVENPGSPRTNSSVTTIAIPEQRTLHTITNHNVAFQETIERNLISFLIPDGFKIEVMDESIVNVPMVKTYEPGPDVESDGGEYFLTLESQTLFATARREGDKSCGYPSTFSKDIFSFKEEAEACRMKMNVPVVNASNDANTGRIRTCDVIVPLPIESFIGSVKLNDFRLGASVKNNLTGRRYRVARSLSTGRYPTPKLLFYDIYGQRVAKSKCVVRLDPFEWKSFELKYFRKTLPVTDKALLLAATIVWIQDTKERKRQGTFCYSLYAFIVVMILFALFCTFIKFIV